MQKNETFKFEDEPKRLDLFLAGVMGGYSREFVKELVKKAASLLTA